MLTQNSPYYTVNKNFWEEGCGMRFPVNIPKEALPIIVKGRALTWINAYDWLINLEWDSKHKINLPKKIAAALKPQGELLVLYFRLCERCHTFQEILRKELGENNLYPHPADWFAEIYSEIVRISVIEDIVMKQEYWEGQSKKNFIEIERKKLAALKKRENPFITNSNLTDLPKFGQQLFRLFACCFVLSETSKFGDRFSSNYWHPFLKAYGKWIQEMKKPHWRTMRVKDGKIYLQGYDRGKMPNTYIGSLNNYASLIDCSKGRAIDIIGQHNPDHSICVEDCLDKSVKNDKNIGQKNKYFETLTLQGL